MYALAAMASTPALSTPAQNGKEGKESFGFLLFIFLSVKQWEQASVYF